MQTSKTTATRHMTKTFQRNLNRLLADADHVWTQTEKDYYQVTDAMIAQTEIAKRNMVNVTKTRRGVTTTRKNVGHLGPLYDDGEAEG